MGSALRVSNPIPVKWAATVQDLRAMNTELICRGAGLAFKSLASSIETCAMYLFLSTILITFCIMFVKFQSTKEKIESRLLQRPEWTTRDGANDPR